MSSPARPAEQHGLLKELIGERCRCGRAKRSRETFCGRCYFLLPKAIRSALYRRIGEGYEQAYSAAIAHLDAGPVKGVRA